MSSQINSIIEAARQTGAEHVGLTRILPDADVLLFGNSSAPSVSSAGDLANIGTAIAQVMGEDSNFHFDPSAVETALQSLFPNGGPVAEFISHIQDELSDHLKPSADGSEQTEAPAGSLLSEGRSVPVENADLSASLVEITKSVRGHVDSFLVGDFWDDPTIDWEPVLQQICEPVQDLISEDGPLAEALSPVRDIISDVIDRCLTGLEPGQFPAVDLGIDVHSLRTTVAELHHVLGGLVGVPNDDWIV